MLMRILHGVRHVCRIGTDVGAPVLLSLHAYLEDQDVCRAHIVRRRTNVQQLTCKMAWFFSFYSLLFSFILFYSLLFSFILFYSLLFSFILFYSLLFSFILFTKTVVKPLNSKRKSWRKNSERSVKICEKVPKSVKKCREDFALSVLPFSFSLNSDT